MLKKRVFKKLIMINGVENVYYSSDNLVDIVYYAIYILRPQLNISNKYKDSIYVILVIS
jgi:hypothetical protein